MKVIWSLAFFIALALLGVACTQPPADGPAATRKAPAQPATTPAPSAPTKQPVTPTSTEGEQSLYTYAEGGIQFAAPTAWKAERDEQGLSLTMADKGLVIVFFIATQGDMNAAVKGLEEEVGKFLKRVRSAGEPDEYTLNGMTTVAEEGTGEINNNPMEWSLHIVQAQKPVIALAFSPKGEFEKHEEAIETLIKTIKKTS